jgi:hypothetical protein
VIHLGDHDPSGIDMTRDIGDRLALSDAETTVRRIALNMNPRGISALAEPRQAHRRARERLHHPVRK